MMELKEVSVKYQDRIAIKDISLKISKGEKVVLLGINGSGKTTLLKLLNALIYPSSGEFLYKGKKLKDAIKDIRKESIMLFQNPDVMLFNPTVYDEVAYSLRKKGLKESEVKEKVMYWLKELAIEDLVSLPPYKLSGGQKQRVALASVLAAEPQILLLDEPTAHMDLPSVGRLIEIIQKTEATCVISTHHISLAPELGNRLVVLSPHGRLLYDGAPENFLKDTSLLLEAGFMHTHSGSQWHFHPL